MTNSLESTRTPPSKPFRDAADLGPSGWAWLESLPLRLLSWLGQSWEDRRARIDLASLDDRTLKDIGISRHEIDRVVRHGRPWD